jgi:hypothetical protein
MAVIADLSSVDAEGQSGTATIQTAQGNRFRSDSTSATGTSSLVINGMRAARFTSDGIEHLPATFALSATPIIFPYLNDLLSGRATAIQVCKLGIAQINGERVFGLQLRRSVAETERLARLRRYTDRATVWISLSTNLPMAIDRDRVALGNYDAGVTIRTLLFEYQTINGVAVPTAYQERNTTEVFFTGHLSGLHFASSIPLTTFDIPKPQAGGAQ